MSAASTRDAGSAAGAPTTEERLLALGARVVAQAERAGAEHAEVLVVSGRELTAKVRLGAPELLEQAETRALGLRVLRAGRQAVCHTADFTDQALEGFVRRAVELAGFAEPDPHLAPPDPEWLARGGPELDLYDPAAGRLSAEAALERALTAEQAARDFDSRITNSEGAACSAAETLRALVTSGGFSGAYRSSTVSLSVEPVADDDDGKKRAGSHWDAQHHLGRLADPAAVGREAARRTLEQLGARKVPTCQVPVVFSPEAGAQVMRTLFSLVTGEAVYRKATYLLDREGTAVASGRVTVVDDALVPAGPGSRPFDGEGLESRRTVVIEEGTLAGFLCDTYSARRLGRAPTGSAGRSVGSPPAVAPSNFRLLPGQATPDEILAATGQGLYVRRLMGFGFNPVTGDFSKGAEGFWIQNGAQGSPVSEVTISANFDELLRGIDLVGQDLDPRYRTASPTFRVARMTVAGS